MKTGAHSKQSSRLYRPLLSIEPVVKTVSRKFEIKEPAAHLIAQYAQYLSEHGGSVVKEDAVVEHLAFLIGKDKGFQEWSKSQKVFTSDQVGS